jgi:hypothetical protein
MNPNSRNLLNFQHSANSFNSTNSGSEKYLTTNENKSPDIYPTGKLAIGRFDDEAIVCAALA